MLYSEINLVKSLELLNINLFNDCNIKKNWSCINFIMKHNKINCLHYQLLVDTKNIDNPEIICEFILYLY